MVVRPLTPDAPAIDGIVEELFPDAATTDLHAFFGAAEAFLSAHLGGTYLPLTAEELKASSMQIKQGAEDIPGLPK